MSVLAGTALALSACGSSGAPTVVGPAPSVVPSTSAAPSALSTALSVTPAASAPAATATHSGSRTTTAADPTSNPNADSDSYAWTHLCTATQITVTLSRLDGAPSRRLISVRNNGAASCGLYDYYPLVRLSSASLGTANPRVTPMVPDGLGGAPAVPVYAGHTAYAVIDLNPSGGTAGAVKDVTEIDVLASSNLPDAATLRTPVAVGTTVLKPKLGLYRDTVADAVQSMTTADMLP